MMSPTVMVHSQKKSGCQVRPDKRPQRPSQCPLAGGIASFYGLAATSTSTLAVAAAPVRVTVTEIDVRFRSVMNGTTTLALLADPSAVNVRAGDNCSVVVPSVPVMSTTATGAPAVRVSRTWTYPRDA